MAEPLRILTLNNIASVGLKRFPASRYQIGSHETDPDAILVRSHDMHSMEIPASVKAIGRAGAGTNNIPVAKMNERGVPVFNAPGANANAVKELVIAGMLLAARNIAPALRFVAGLKGDDAGIDKQVEENSGVGALNTFERGVDSINRNQDVVVSHTGVLSNRSINEVRVQFGRHFADNIVRTPLDQPTINRPSGNFGKPSNQPQGRTEDRLQIVDALRTA